MATAVTARDAETSLVEAKTSLRNSRELERCRVEVADAKAHTHGHLGALNTAVSSLAGIAGELRRVD